MTQELRKLAEAATQGPWIAGDDEDSDYYLVGPPSFGTVVTNPVVQLHALNNAEYIAAANPVAILDLLDRVEKAEKDAGRYQWLRNGPLVDGEICEELYVAVDSPAWPGKWALVGSDLDKAVDAMEASK